MKHVRSAIIFLTITAFLAAASSKQDLAQQEAQRIELLNRIETMKNMYAHFQEQFRETIETRWKQQQEHLRLKEEYKNTIEELRQRQEILYNEVSRAKEEALVHENAVQEQVDALKEKKELIDFLNKQIRDKVGDAAKGVREGFPFGMESHVAQLNEIDAQLARGESAATGLKRLLQRRLDWLKESLLVSAGRETIVLNEGDPVSGEVIRIGNCMAYGVAPSGTAYLLSSNAKNRQFRYEWRPIKEPLIREKLVGSFPAWLKTGKLSGAVPIDVLQNSISGQLFEGHKKSLRDKFFEYVKAGGPNILVLCAAGLIALLLVIDRFFVLFRRAVSEDKFISRFISHIREGKIEQAQKMLKRSPSTLARCLRLLAPHLNAPRETAEKALKEAFLKELPPLESRLSLLAALGAAAPLLGLLGTVGGLITLFQVLNMAGTNDTKVLAGGISEALVNTETGLAIAIPVLLIHGYLSEKAAHIQNSAQAAAAEVLNSLWPVLGPKQDKRELHD